MTALVLRGGEVFDPETGQFAVRDVRIADGVFAGPAVDGDELVDVTGMVVCPGLVDLHTHVFTGQDLGVDPDDFAPPAGTTTLIDTGSAGGHLFGAFRRSAVERSATRIRAFLNISSVGTTSIMLGGELKAPHYANEDVAVECIEANRDLLIGVKVRASADVGGEHATEALRRARRVADRVALPLMVHLGPRPAAIDEIASLLGKGDILTHAFSGWEGNRVILDGRLRDSVRAARDRGALLDIGHGMSGFDPGTARAMLELGELPDTISTDLHTYSRHLVVDFPTVLSKFLALGMSLPQVLARATLAPARAASLADSGVGTLRVGAPADVAVLRRVAGDFDLGGIPATERLECVVTLAAGRTVYDGRAAA
ncbi:MAG: amidohydrolase [Rhodoglobus sp.]|nr:amidohydrolase [Rhodoglobus sp.]